MNQVDKVIHGMQNGDSPSDYWMIPDIKFPELTAGRLVIQRNGQSVLQHTMTVIDSIMPKTPTTLLSGLFHDLGKSLITPGKDVSLPRFPNHAMISANIARIKLTEWQASPDLIHRVVCLIENHMYDIKDATQEKTIRKFVAKVGPTNIENWFALRIADSYSYDIRRDHYSHLIEQFRVAVMFYLEKQPGVEQPELIDPRDSGGIHIQGTVTPADAGNIHIKGGEAS